MLSNFADFQMYQNNGISPLNLTAMLQKEYGELYPLMDRSKWHKLAKAYISQKTMRYDVPDDEPVTWKMAAEPIQPSMKC